MIRNSTAVRWTAKSESPVQTCAFCFSFSFSLVCEDGLKSGHSQKGNYLDLNILEGEGVAIGRDLYIMAGINLRLNKLLSFQGSV